MDGAIASLTGNEKLQPSKDQSTTEKHIVSDLLIATGVPAIDNSSGIILSLQFQHQFALLVLQPQVYVGVLLLKGRLCLPYGIEGFRNRLGSY